jgi:predicted amidophosphoribosyltransferase
LAFKFAKLGVETFGIQAVVPIPAHKNNSMDHAYILAQVISEKLTLPFWPFALAHLQADWPNNSETSLPQKSLGLHERSQVKFRARTSALGGRLLLVDDVITTGLTILEAAEALKVPNAIALTITSRDFVL